MMSLRVPLLCVLMSVLFGSLSAQIDVDFNASETEGCGSLQVTFCDNSTSSAGNIVAWDWDLCGVNADTNCPGRIFGTPGSCTICLTVTDAAGNTATECMEDMITVFPLPEPDFEANILEGCSPLSVEITDLSTTGNANIVDWVWGAGGSCGVVVATNGDPLNCTYTNADDYTISLTITDDNGCVNTVTKTDYLQVYEDPMTTFSASDTFNCSIPFVVNFGIDNIVPGFQYQWNFGNGQTFTGATPPAVAYNQFDQFDVQLVTINPGSGCVDTVLRQNYIQVGYPADFTISNESGCTGMEVLFSDISQLTADSIMWDFGDGTTANALNVSHTYPTEGCYTITLTRYIGDCPSIETFDCLEIFPRPEFSYELTNSEGCTLPHVTTINGLSTGTEINDWEFLIRYVGSGEILTSIDTQSGTVEINEYGEFYVHLSVSDVNGCVSGSISDTIHIMPLQASILNEQVEGCVPLNFTLGDNTDTPGTITSWDWQINTPSGILSSSNPTPAFSVVDTGCFDVRLIVENSLGCKDTIVSPNLVCGGNAPSVNFSATPTVTCVESEVQFTDLSSDNANQWAWDFESDGEIDNFMANPSYEYNDTGYYDVTLVAFQNGCGSQLVISDFIQILPPNANAAVQLSCDDYFTVNFNDISIGADSLFFDFGIESIETDTSSSSLPFDFVFPDTGDYLVLQYAFNFATGCIDTMPHPITIAEPIADFDLSTDFGCAPLTLELTDNSQFAETFFWSSNEGIVVDTFESSTSITFESPGTFTDLSLIITDVNECKDTIDYGGQIKVNGVEAGFDILPPGGCVPLDVQLVDTSQNMFSNSMSWTWIINDSIVIEDGPSINYTFDSIGVYDVQLAVIDDWGCGDTVLVEEAISVSMPTAYFEADSLGCTLSGLQFQNLSGGFGLTYDWDFGDGNSSTEQAPVHQYANEGIYTVCLTVTAPDGCENSFCRDDITIANPISQFSIDNDYASCPPLLVNFENNSSNAANYTWDFGDNSGISNLDSPAHIYTIPGTYNVSLIVSGIAGCVDTFIVEDLITLEGPQGDFSFEVDTLCVPATVNFTGYSDDIYDFVWDYGNGLLDTVSSVNTSSLTYTYENPGLYVPQLILVDGLGCSRPIANDSILLNTLELDFYATDTALCDASAQTTFMNMSTSTSPITNIEWYFEDGAPSSSTEMEPSSTFSSAGLHDVWLIAQTEFCRDTLIKNDFIGVGATPSAAFTMSVDFGCEPLEVTFTDNSTAGGETIAQWYWDFGRGDFSTEQSPTHSFLGGDDIEITLQVTTEAGCTDSITQTINVMSANDVMFNDVPEICMGENVQINAFIDTSLAAVTNFYWEANTTLSCIGCVDPIANPMETTTYEFVVVNENGCEGRHEVTVDVIPVMAPNVGLTADATICKGDVIQLVASGGMNVFEYQWDSDSPGLNCYENCFNPVASPTESSVYTVTVTNEFGCSNSASVEVTVLDQFMPIAGPDRTICEGDTVQVSLDMGSNPIWTPSEGLSCVNCPMPVASPENSTNYVVTVQTAMGCEVKDSLYIDVMHPYEIDAGEDVEICIGSSIILNGKGVGEYLWTPDQYLNNNTDTSPIASPTEPIKYLLNVTKGDCTLTDSVFINTLEKTNISAADTVLCPGMTAELDIEGFADEFEWIPSNYLSNPFVQNPLVTPETEMFYTVIGRLGTCEPDTTTLMVELMQEPQVYLAPEHTFFPGQTIVLNVYNEDDGLYQYEWDLNDGLSCTDCPMPSVAPMESRFYTVTVIDLESGCEKELTTLVKLLDRCGDKLINVPNIFSPNDDKINDKVYPYSSTISTISNFTIFNRWGGIVYTQSNFPPGDSAFSWDGNTPNGKAPAGVYVYLLEAVCDLDGSTITKKGDITLLR